MGVKKEYRSVIIKLEPTPREEKILENNLMKVSKFLEISKSEFQSSLYKKIRATIPDMHTKAVTLLVKRFTDTVMNNLIYPLGDKNNRNYKFIKENGWYKVEIRFKPREKVVIPIARPDCKYYSDILDGAIYPGSIFKQGANYFISISMPIKKRWENGRPTVYIGIDLNQRKHAASLYNPKTGKYERNLFFDLKPVNRKVDEIWQEIKTIDRERRNRRLTEEENEKRRQLYNTLKKVIQKGHGDFISKLIKVADEYWEKGYNVVFVLENLKGIIKRVEKRHKHFNRWLHSQWCYRKFANMLETKPYRVEEVNPRDTSKFCHKCGSEVEIYGKYKRLIRCKNCGYKDFSRDLNAARNIAKRGEEIDLFS